MRIRQRAFMNHINTPAPRGPTSVISYDLDILDRNIAIMRDIERQVGDKLTILYALKASYAVLPYFKSQGVVGEVSSLGEALLSGAHLPGKCHAFCVSLTDNDWTALEPLISHISFNSLTQGARFAARATAKNIACGVRVNPRHSVSSYADYDPCRRGCRFGLDINELPQPLPSWVSGLHMHALCENGAHEFIAVLEAFESKVGHLLPSLSWVNLGGGLLCTADDFDREAFVTALKGFSNRHPHLSLYLEPGAAWVWNAGTLETEVTDVVERAGIRTAVLDFSFRAHGSDFLIGSAIADLPLDAEGFTPIEPGSEASHPSELLYHFGGASCAMCDTKGPYLAEREIQIRDRLRFRNMGHYVDVTFSWFNGIVPPSIEYRRGGLRELVVVRGAEGFCGVVGL